MGGWKIEKILSNQGRIGFWWWFQSYFVVTYQMNPVQGFIIYIWKWFHEPSFFKWQLGVPLTVYPWYLLWGIIHHKYPLYRAYIGISHKGMLVGVHPTIPSIFGDLLFQKDLSEVSRSGWHHSENPVYLYSEYGLGIFPGTPWSMGVVWEWGSHYWWSPEFP